MDTEADRVSESTLATLSADAKRALLADLLRRRAQEEDVMYQLSHGQRALWVLHQLAPSSSAYHIGFPARVRLDDPARLRAALQQVVDRHPALRTTFTVRAGELMQRVASSGRLAFEEVDASGWSDEALGRAVDEAHRRPFDLERGPLARVSLFSRTPTEHMLLLTVHHIVSDAWSLIVLLDELRALYAGGSGGGAPPAATYADYVRWQAALLRSPEGRRLQAYWHERLGGELGGLDLPTDRPRPAVGRYRGATHTFVLARDLMERLRAYSRTRGVTLYAMLLAAYQVLLARYSGQDDIVVGSPAAGRGRAEFARTMGYFVNMLALRADLSGDPPFETLLDQVARTAIEALEHQDYPFPLLVQELSPVRDPGRSPIFQTMFSLLPPITRLGALSGYQLTDDGLSLRLPDLELVSVPLPQQEGQFDLALELVETPAGLRGSLRYDTDLFESATAARMAGHFATLLESILASPATRVSRLSILPPAERRRLVREWNATAAPEPEPGRVHSLVEAQVDRTPCAVAVVADGAGLTYDELDRRANRLAHYLRELGVGRDTLVGVCLDRSLGMLVALLGVLKAGGAYLPLDPAYPDARRRFMIEDSGAAVLITRDGLADGVASPAVRVLRLDAEAEAIAAAPATRPAPAGTRDDLAYVIYTSGSTGRPKGVAVTHRNVVNFLAAMRDAPGLIPQDVLLSVTTLAFDIAGLELYLPLIVGARVVLVSREVATDGRRLAAALAESGATVMQATPATWRLLLEAGWQGQSDLTVLCGGEALPRDLADALTARAGSVWNLYGPTETTIWSTAERVGPGTGPVPIGRPIANTTLYVLDRHREPVPTGVPGELYIGGVGVARGYLNRPELTAERFVPDPFDPMPGSRLYRTGDRVRYLSDGRVEYFGRLDHQLKLRGFRVEPGEIEAVLREHAGVREAVVVARTDVAGGPALVAYVVAADERAGPDVLRTMCKQRLPDYMVPARIVLLEHLPRTPNGKLDRAALPTPHEAAAPERQVLPPRDATERVLVDAWERVMKTQPVGVTDDFFDLGGHSLLAAQVLAEIEAVTGTRLPLSALFQARTVEQLARRLREAADSATCVLVPLRPTGGKPPLFVGGSNPRYAEVARQLGPDQPMYGLDVYALQATRLAQGRRPLTRVADIAAEFLAAIRGVQSSGPYHLAGGCEGAIVAFEIAQQLREQGEETALLVIWETPVPRLLAGPVRRLARQVASVFEGRSIGDLRLREWPAVLRHAYIEHVIFRAVGRYRPCPYPGRLTVLRADEELGRMTDPTAGWGAVAAGGVELRRVRGSHRTYLTANTGPFAAELRACLVAPAGAVS